MMNHKVKKKFGQNFLVDAQIIHRILRAIAPKPTDNMLEIGVGMGALTLPLLEVLDQLNVVEIDRDLAKIWQEKNLDNLSFHNDDILKFDLNTLPQPLRVVGNLPYNISSPILIKMLEHKHLIQDMCFMLQKEVAQRITAKHGNKIYGRLSVILQTYFEVDYLFTVPNTAFEPAPKVESAIIIIKPKIVNNLPQYQSLSFVVKQAFSMRRKTLANCLKSHLKQDQTSIDLKQRAEALSIEDFAVLTQDYIATL